MSYYANARFFKFSKTNLDAAAVILPVLLIRAVFVSTRMLLTTSR